MCTRPETSRATKPDQGPPPWRTLRSTPAQPWREVFVPMKTAIVPPRFTRALIGVAFASCLACSSDQSVSEPSENPEPGQSNGVGPIADQSQDTPLPSPGVDGAGAGAQGAPPPVAAGGQPNPSDSSQGGAPSAGSNAGGQPANGGQNATAQGGSGGTEPVEPGGVGAEALDENRTSCSCWSTISRLGISRRTTRTRS